MTEVETAFKDNWGDCQCGLPNCNLTGTLRKPWRTGLRCVKGCPCNHCRGKRSKVKGRTKQASAVRSLGIPRSNLHPGHEEFLPGAVRTEVKAGLKAKTVDTAYRNVREQSDAAKAIGDNRPFTPVFMPDGASYGYVVIRTDELANAVDALYHQLIDQGV